MEKQLTALEALQDFFSTTRTYPEGKIPADVSVMGSRMKKKLPTVPTIAAFLEKYAPGEYSENLPFTKKYPTM